MKIFSNLVNMLIPKSDSSVIYKSIDELPNPRDWGRMDFISGKKLIFSEDMDLAAPSTDAIETLIGPYLQ